MKSLTLVCCVLTPVLVNFCLADVNRFNQDRFAIGLWVDPPADDKMDQRYKEIADANFTLVIGGANNENCVKKQD